MESLAWIDLRSDTLLGRKAENLISAQSRVGLIASSQYMGDFVLEAAHILAMDSCMEIPPYTLDIKSSGFPHPDT